MILYNMRKRGPYEYDKFTLNILQISNAITLSEMHELSENNKEKDTLLKMKEHVDTIYKFIVGTNEDIGLSEKVYLKSYIDRGNTNGNQENVITRI